MLVIERLWLVSFHLRTVAVKSKVWYSVLCCYSWQCTPPSTYEWWFWSIKRRG